MKITKGEQQRLINWWLQFAQIDFSKVRIEKKTVFIDSLTSALWKTYYMEGTKKGDLDIFGDLGIDADDYKVFAKSFARKLKIFIKCSDTKISISFRSETSIVLQRSPEEGFSSFPRHPIIPENLEFFLARLLKGIDFKKLYICKHCGKIGLNVRVKKAFCNSICESQWEPEK